MGLISKAWTNLAPSGAAAHRKCRSGRSFVEEGLCRVTTRAATVQQ